jgi:hypothetical protein
VIGVPVCFPHYSIVWVVIDGVDVVADNAARVPVFLRTGLCALSVLMWGRCWRQHRKVGCVVRENIDARAGWYQDRCVGRKRKAANKISPQIKEHHD